MLTSGPISVLDTSFWARGQPQLCLHRTDYFKRLRNHINVADFEVVDTVEADGLYIFKRPVRAATGQGQMLNQAGTVFYHVLLYIKAAGKVGLMFQRANARANALIITPLLSAAVVS